MESFYFTILQLLKEGKIPSQISKELNISPQRICYYTTTLKKIGFIEKKGYGVWEVKRTKRKDLEDTIRRERKKIRGHAFIWKVKSKKFSWIELLEKNKVPYKLVRGFIPRIFIKNRKVWLSKNSIIVYETKSFYGRNAIESRKYAVYELICVLRALERILGVSLGRYRFQPTREHFGMIRNELARQCNKKGEKIIVKDDLDGEWFWIDDSESLGELETGGKGIAQDRAGLNMNVQNWYNDHKKHKFQVTPSFVLNSLDKQGQIMNGIQMNQMSFGKNLSTHIKAIKTLSQAVNDLKKEVKKINGNKM